MGMSLERRGQLLEALQDEIAHAANGSRVGAWELGQLVHAVERSKRCRQIFREFCDAHDAEAFPVPDGMAALPTPVDRQTPEILQGFADQDARDKAAARKLQPDHADMPEPRQRPAEPPPNAANPFQGKPVVDGNPGRQAHLAAAAGSQPTAPGVVVTPEVQAAAARVASSVPASETGGESGDEEAGGPAAASGDRDSKVSHVKGGGPHNEPAAKVGGKGGGGKGK